MKTRLLTGFAAMCMAASSPAAVTFYSNDQTGFANAMTAATLTSLGTEPFFNTLPAGSSQNLTNPLQQGVPNGSFVNGLVVPMTVQTNSLGGNPTTTTGGNFLLAEGGGGNRGNLTSVVARASTIHSLDWIFAPSSLIMGVDLNPFLLGNVSGGTTGLSNNLQVRVYSTDNTLLGQANISADAAATQYLGIEATGGDLIGRINFWSTDPGRIPGGDNATLWAAPEPSRVLLLMLGIGGLWLRQRRGNGVR